jgi:hypothetical protein
MGEMRKVYRISVTKLEGKIHHLGELCIDGRIILRYIEEIRVRLNSSSTR